MNPQKGISVNYVILTLCFQFKELVSSKFNAPVPQLCLIFAGRILKDAETLASYCKFLDAFYRKEYLCEMFAVV